MWCRDCQQDVPAVASSVNGPLVCSRCEASFDTGASFTSATSRPADSGVSLESIEERPNLEPPINPRESAQTQEQLRRIGRQLRTAYRHDPGFTSPPPVSNWGPEALNLLDRDEQLRAVRRHAREKSSAHSRPTLVSRLISMLLVLGLAGFIAGASLLLWGTAFGLPKSWQWGMTVTFVAEGALIVGLTWMAGRLWRNSRYLNQQLVGVDQQLHDIEHLTGSLAASRMSGSQHYYEHFHQGASNHMLLANLRGQVDQLASRMAS